MKPRVNWHIEYETIGRGWTLWRLGYPLKKWAVTVGKTSYARGKWRVVKFVEVTVWGG